MGRSRLIMQFIYATLASGLLWDERKIEWDREKEVVSASDEKPSSERVKKKRAISLSCASLCREATLEKRIYSSSSHISGFTLLFI